MSQDYITIKIPTALIDTIEELVEINQLGYRNRSEFIIESIRMRLKELKNQKQEAEVVA